MLISSCYGTVNDSYLMHVVPRWNAIKQAPEVKTLILVTLMKILPDLNFYFAA